MTLRIPANVLLHVWSYDFYDMTLSTGKQRRHMINDSSVQEEQTFYQYMIVEYKRNNSWMSTGVIQELMTMNQ